MNKEAAGMLGILNRGGALAFGEGTASRLHKGHLLLLALDASPRTKKEYEEPARRLRLPIYYISSKQDLGLPLGRDELSAVLVLNAKAAKALKEKLQKGEQS